uniref:Heme oxygenase n=1 Tax=Batrachospermum sp. TaxID=31373 RepID=A0A8K1YUP0_9FLOR|nr:Heme oxygenase [Batrachospermum sp.]
MSLNLATQLREGTTKSHSMAENVSFVKSFLGGVVDKKSYRKLVANLYFIYSTLEEKMFFNRNHPIVKPIYFLELNRKASLEKDLIFYYGSDWANLIKPSEATKNYIDRINKISLSQPELLIAHAYTRYIGDLSGGQILKKIAENAMGLSNGDGVAFYNFFEIQDDSKFKKLYKDKLNELPLTQKQISDIISEANIAFTLNMKMFQELNSNFMKIMLLLFINAINKFRITQHQLS